MDELEMSVKRKMNKSRERTQETRYTILVQKGLCMR